MFSSWRRRTARRHPSLYSLSSPSAVWCLISLLNHHQQRSRPHWSKQRRWFQLSREAKNEKNKTNKNPFLQSKLMVCESFHVTVDPLSGWTSHVTHKKKIHLFFGVVSLIQNHNKFHTISLIIPHSSQVPMKFSCDWADYRSQLAGFAKVQSPRTLSL